MKLIWECKIFFHKTNMDNICSEYSEIWNMNIQGELLFLQSNLFNNITRKVKKDKIRKTKYSHFEKLLIRLIRKCFGKR